MRRFLTVRRIIVLVALCLLAGVAVVWSLASFTTTSKTRINASVAGAGSWLQLYSQGTDPSAATIYARSRLLDGGVGGWAATGRDDTLAVDLGGFPDSNKTFPFTTVFALAAPAQFPDPAVSQVTVSITLVADAGGEQPLRAPSLTPFGSTAAGATSVTLTPGQVYQFNVTVAARKKFIIGQTYTPSVLVDVTLPGGAAVSYRYTVPIKVTDVGGK